MQKNISILLTSTSFQDTPGPHHDLLNSFGFDIKYLRGPLREHQLIDIIGGFDGLICGDDEITQNVINRGYQGRLRVISKYGIGLDKVDVEAANAVGIPVTNCPGVNQVTVAEHVLSLLLAFLKNIITETEFTRNGKWTRLIGNELYGKTVGIVGLGSIGKELAKRLSAFGVKLMAFDKFHDTQFTERYDVDFRTSISDLLPVCDILSLHLSLNNETRNILNGENIKTIKPGCIIVNTARAGLMSEQTVEQAISDGLIKGYLTDVLEEEPMKPGHPFLKYQNIIITPHIGSRTYESVARQGTMAVENLIKEFKKNQIL